MFLFKKCQSSKREKNNTISTCIPLPLIHQVSSLCYISELALLLVGFFPEPAESSRCHDTLPLTPTSQKNKNSVLRNHSTTTAPKKMKSNSITLSNIQSIFNLPQWSPNHLLKLFFLI